MRFLEDLRSEMTDEEGNPLSKYALARMLGMSPQAYHALTAKEDRDRIRIRDLLAVRNVLSLSDSELLDSIQEEFEEYAEIFS